MFKTKLHLFFFFFFFEDVNIDCEYNSRIDFFYSQFLLYLLTKEYVKS